MEHVKNELITKDGTGLFTQAWTVNDSIADLVLVHGMAEHSGRYQWVAEQFTSNKINVFTMDLRGHGKSEGERAYIQSFDQYLNDLKELIDIPDMLSRPFFILGHSMGGLIVTSFLADNPEINCKGAILSAPALKIGDDIPPILIKLSSLISGLFPKLKSTKLDPNNISRSPETIKEYLTDPLIYRKGVKARLGAEMIRYMLKVRGQYPNFEFPVLAMHGTADKLADPQGSQWLFDEVKSEDKKLELLPGLYHEILNEPEKESVINTMIEWITKRA